MQPIFDFLGETFFGGGLQGASIAFVVVLTLVKILLILGGILQIVPMIVLMERKIISWVQDRPGPNRAGPWGILHGILDGVKLFFKEEITPKGVNKVLFLMAPSLVVVPAFLALCLVPVGPIIRADHLDALAGFLRLNPEMVSSTGMISHIAMAITNPNVGILYVLAVTSIGVYGITIAGWSSNNKWALLGGIRASAQMISYEITMSLAIIAVVLVSGSLNLYEIINTQGYNAAQAYPSAYNFTGDAPLIYNGFWNWNVVALPVAMLLFIVAMFAETNRVPFDLAEAEAELTGGFHTEYSSMRFALFFLGEYVNMVIVSAMCTTLFLGGFAGLININWEMVASWVSGLYPPQTNNFGLFVIIASYAIGPVLIMPAKVAFFVFLFIFARATLPRFRYDQLMDLGWKKMLPMGLVNLVLTAVVVAVDIARRSAMEGSLEANPNMSLLAKLALGATTLILFLAYDRVVLTGGRQKQLAAEYKTFRDKKERPEPALVR